jgi:hypothetical protein
MLCPYRTLFTASCLFGILFSSLARSEEPLSYDRHIRPILSENCFACHGFDEKTREAGLRLDTRAGAIDEGGAIEPGSPETSWIVERMESEDVEVRMPPPHSGKSLTAEQIGLIKRWISDGAIYEEHWAFSPPVAKAPPPSERYDHPIDRFVMAELAARNLHLSPLANHATLIRRLSLDLIGLPPTPQQVDDFETAASKNTHQAILELVDRLLDSPHFGERWGRWWLDQARYADSHGYSIDGEREMWNYRDWVINALNRDMGFDQFTIEQIAGDLLPNPTIEQRIATGFHRNTQINQEGGVDPEQFRMDSVFDRVATTGNVWLGLSIGCAQCHDHKFDPITQHEYFQLFAFLNNQDEPTIKVYPDGVDGPTVEGEAKQLEGFLRDAIGRQQESLDQWEAALDAASRETLPKAVLKLLKSPRDKRSLSDRGRLLLASGVSLPDGQNATDESPANENALGSPVADDKKGEATNNATGIAAAIERLDEVNRVLATASAALVLQERSELRPTFLLIKGDFTRPDIQVAPGTPSVLHPLPAVEERVLNRMDLARWLVADDNPLTSRVIANRVWQQLFGQGIVETENDFGLQGTPPSHPALLDWLAIELRSHNWSLKHLIRSIVTSHTYLQSSAVRQELNAADPLNILLGRQHRLRLDAEIVRDVALVASDLFCDVIGGPSVRPPIPDGVMSQGQIKRDWRTSQGGDRYRRAMYTFAYRVTPPPALSVFDAPDGLSSCTRRIRSNTPLQALTLLNDPAFVEFAQAMEAIVKREGVEAAFQRCTSRRPTLEELAILKQLDTLGIARALLNLDETITRE